MARPWEDELDAVGVLIDPVRRSMYSFVRAAARPVTREDVAEATGSSVKLAAFHLDKLIEEGWLRSRSDSSERPARGGRPPKQYEPTERQVSLSLPGRRYDVMARILLDAVHGDEGQLAQRVRQAGYERGRALAEASRTGGGRRRKGAERTLAAVAGLLAELGFEPRRTRADEVTTANCPFRALAEAAPDTVCDAAQALAEGLVAGSGGSGVEAGQDRAGGGCCVVLRRSVPPQT